MAKQPVGSIMNKRGRAKCSLITQIVAPTRVRRVIERAARTVLFLPENAYVRNIRITEDMVDKV
jgi:hypothetical protein